MTNEQGGTTANRNGKILEDTLIPIFIAHGYEVVHNRDEHNVEHVDKYVLTHRPYTSIYEHKGKTEFLLVRGERKIRIECKWQQSKGSVDEKLPYLYLNSVFAFEENEIIILLDGGGYKQGAEQWLRNAASTNWLQDGDKDIKVMNLTEFISFFNSELR